MNTLSSWDILTPPSACAIQNLLTSHSLSSNVDDDSPVFSNTNQSQLILSNAYLSMKPMLFECQHLPTCTVSFYISS